MAQPLARSSGGTAARPQRGERGQNTACSGPPFPTTLLPETPNQAASQGGFPPSAGLDRAGPDPTQGPCNLEPGPWPTLGHGAAQVSGSLARSSCSTRWPGAPRQPSPTEKGLHPWSLPARPAPMASQLHVGAGRRPRDPATDHGPHTPGRTGRSPQGPLVGERPRTMQSNRKLICSPSAEDRKKTPAPAGDRRVSRPERRWVAPPQGGSGAGNLGKATRPPVRGVPEHLDDLLGPQ